MFRDKTERKHLYFDSDSDENSKNNPKNQKSSKDVKAKSGLKQRILKNSNSVSCLKIDKKDKLEVSKENIQKSWIRNNKKANKETASISKETNIRNYDKDKNPQISFMRVKKDKNSEESKISRDNKDSESSNRELNDINIEDQDICISAGLSKVKSKDKICKNIKESRLNDKKL